MVDNFLNRLQSISYGQRNDRNPHVIIQIIVEINYHNEPVWWSVSEYRCIEPHYIAFIPSILDWSNCISDILARGTGTHRLYLVAYNGQPVKWLDILQPTML